MRSKVDTNVLLQYLIQPLDSRNPDWQHKAATKIIDVAEQVYVTDIVLAEVEWVLESQLPVVLGYPTNNALPNNDWLQEKKRIEKLSW